MTWPPHPRLYEINTCIWLRELSRKYVRSITLLNVPPQEWDVIARLHMDAVWFMGVWERSPSGLAIARNSRSLMSDCRRVLPDLTEQDYIGSPYCVRRYVVDSAFGGLEGLAEARKQLIARGLRLMLDFVPNHVAPDHPWIDEHSEYFVSGDFAELSQRPDAFIERNGRIYACGRDPFFPAWSDVVQLNAFQQGLRRAASDTLLSIAMQCDGVRCDMAMLLLNVIFERTWGKRVGPRPETDYWSDVIGKVRAQHNRFIFVAEAYWDLEWELQQQGFDFCYDKRLYDRLELGEAEPIRQHLQGALSYQRCLVRFIENHDEPRAAATFFAEKHRAAAIVSMTLPGAKLLHEGQLQGRQTRVPVFLTRRPDENPDPGLERFYAVLLKHTAQEPLRSGEWTLCECLGWSDNMTCRNLLTWGWRRGAAHSLVIVNFSAAIAQGRVQVPWSGIASRTWQLTDLFTERRYDRSGDEMLDLGLFVSLEPWGWHLFSLEALP
jgi:hypothetical protein